MTTRGTLFVRVACAAALALIAWAAGARPGLFVLDRSAVEHGELWRLWTGHFVHGSAHHFRYDVGAAALLCVAFGLARRLLWMAPVISGALLVVLPDLEQYYGLSALLHAWVVAIAAELLVRENGKLSLAAAGLLIGTLAKAAIETWTGASLFTADLNFGGPVLHASHLVGALIGALTGRVHSVANQSDLTADDLDRGEVLVRRLDQPAGPL